MLINFKRLIVGKNKPLNLGIRHSENHIMLCCIIILTILYGITLITLNNTFKLLTQLKSNQEVIIKTQTSNYIKLKQSFEATQNKTIKEFSNALQFINSVYPTFKKLPIKSQIKWVSYYLKNNKAISYLELNKEFIKEILKYKE